MLNKQRSTAEVWRSSLIVWIIAQLLRNITANNTAHPFVALRCSTREVVGVDQPKNNPDDHEERQDIQWERRCREAEAGKVITNCAWNGWQSERNQRDQQDHR